MTKRTLVRAVMAAVCLVSIEGCAAVGLTLFGVGAGVTAGTGTAYTLDGIAYRTFASPLDELRQATVTTLKRMDMVVKSDEPTDQGRTILAQAADRAIDIQLERLSTRTTRMRVVAKQGVFFKDRATAGEIIAQTERSLDEMPAVSQRAN